MKYEDLKMQLENINGAVTTLREDSFFKDRGVSPTFYIVEFSIENHDLFYKNIPPFAEYVFCISKVSDVIKKYNERKLPYTISFPVEVENSDRK